MNFADWPGLSDCGERLFGHLSHAGPGENTMASRIEDYAMIGDCEAAALVSKDGSIDWLCLPRFDSGACFAALLGTPEHGRWMLGPASPAIRIARRYRRNTLTLETEVHTDQGSVTLIDFMPGSGAACPRRVTNLFERLLKVTNDLGLLSEEYDPEAKRLVGNFPQAFSHAALVNTALILSRPEGLEPPRKDSSLTSSKRGP